MFVCVCVCGLEMCYEVGYEDIYIEYDVFAQCGAVHLSGLAIPALHSSRVSCSYACASSLSDVFPISLHCLHRLLFPLSSCVVLCIIKEGTQSLSFDVAMSV